MIVMMLSLRLLKDKGRILLLAKTLPPSILEAFFYHILFFKLYTFSSKNAYKILTFIFLILKYH